MKIIGNIGNIGHKLGLERQILIDGLRGCCFRQLMVGRLNVKAYHLFGIAIDTVDILLPVLLLAGDAAGIVGQAGETAVGLQGIRERVARFQGEMKIESTPGKGTHVTITIKT